MMSDPAAPVPPWLYRPGSDATDGCWRQGREEAWLLDRWLPFWRSATPAARAAYLKQYPPPDELWRQYLTEVWSTRSG